MAHAIAWAILFSGHAAADDVRWTVSVDDPSSGWLRVTLTIPSDSMGDRTYADFVFLDANGPSGRVDAIRASVGSATLKTEMLDARQGIAYRVRMPEEANAPLNVTYTVDPSFFTPGSTDGARENARGILEANLGILRTRTVFPAGRHIAANASVRFELPDGWTAVTPWEREGGTFMLPPNALRDTEYLGIGPFDIAEPRIKDTPYRIASIAASNELIGKLPVLIETEERIAGLPPRLNDAIHTVILVPRGFMQGGSAGRRTVVQPPDVVTLAHEIFHWWNHSEITAPDARWFSEGFTEYFAIEAARAAGLVSDMQANMCFADLQGEMRYLERSEAMSLADASRRYGEREAQRIVYAKGALFAYWLERELRDNGRTIRDVLPIVFGNSDRRHDNAALADAFDRAFDGTMNDAFHRFVESANPLPNLDLPEATGQSGRARFLPQR